MNFKDLVTNTSKLQYKELCSALIERFGVKQTVKWDSVLPNEQQQTLFGGEILRLISDHPTLASQKEIRPVCLMKGDLSQLLFFYVQLKDEQLPKSAIERIARKFIGGAAADRYIIWFFGNKAADVLKIVISGKEGKKIKLKTLALEAGQWFKTYDYILSEVERKFNTDGLFQDFKEPSGLWKALWDAFDISIVNKKFYAEIKAIFDALTKEELPKCKGLFKNDQDRVQFAIRLIGRIIFCWFLKRKGIITGEVMSARAVEAEQNYYRDILELLFFDVFNTPLNERRKDLPDSIKNYPFLNGGLFEPQHQDHKGNWALNISNNWFINFFNNTLERYNFTVDENSAASSEIAIDPEMLGRIFENLLAEQNPETGESARKSTGSYYTPREIVDFMVEESLIAYLKTLKGGQNDVMLYPLSKGAQSLPEDAIEDFVHTGSLPDSLKPHSKELLDRLNVIKVLDPACGSGAFPMSMLQKLAGLKHQLAANETPYNIKLKTIENSIYGVDIQPMATELSRLRCWLSLIVDEDPKDIKPLPNLDFKFVTANSLIDLGYDEFLQDIESGKIGKMFLGDFLKDLDALKAVRQKYFEPSLRQKEKDKLKKDFNAIKDDLFKMSLELIKQRLLDVEFANKVTGWDPFDDSKAAPFFNKSWMFGVEDGFDVVIGNPPYLQLQKLKGNPLQKAYKDQNYTIHDSSGDLYCLFYEKGIQTLKGNGILCLITSNKWMRAGYGQKLRGYFAQHNPLILIDLGPGVFESATVDTNILLIQKSENRRSLQAVSVTNKGSVDLASMLIDNSVTLANVGQEAWFVGNNAEQKLKEKIESIGKPLKEWNVKIFFGIKTGLNEAFIIDQATRDNLITKDPKSADILKPILRGRDIKCYSYKWAGVWLIQAGFDINVPKLYPEIYKHLLHFEEKAKKRDDQGQNWWNLRACAYYGEFEKEKVIWKRIGSILRFGYDSDGLYAQDSTCIMTGAKLKYICAFMNSKLGNKLLFDKAPKTGTGDVIVSVQALDPLLIPPITTNNKLSVDKIESVVDQILVAIKKDQNANTSAFEKQIDDIVYALYNLTPEEIAIVEGHRV